LARPFVAFEHLQTTGRPIQKALKHLYETLKQCELYGFKLLNCYHFVDLYDNNYLTETQQLISFGQILTKRYGLNGAYSGRLANAFSNKVENHWHAADRFKISYSYI
jgi:hypothetical protein